MAVLGGWPGQDDGAYRERQARTFDFHSGNVVYFPRGTGHYIENTGSDDLRYPELFKSPYYQDVSLT